MPLRSLPLLALLALLAPLSLASAQKLPVFTADRCASLPVLICNVQPTDGYRTDGAVYFSPVWRQRVGTESFSCFTRVTASIAGLSGPTHGFHIHTYGDLSTRDGTSTGGHFSDPQGSEVAHGYPEDADRHWGDFGNIQVDAASGIATYDRVDDFVRLGGILGRAITIHEAADKGAAEQPSGDAGARVGFCVIGYSNPEVLSAR